MYLLKKSKNWTGGVAQMVQRLLCKHEAQVQIPVPLKKK
jgi:hypothetical protein